MLLHTNCEINKCIRIHVVNGERRNRFGCNQNNQKIFEHIRKHSQIHFEDNVVNTQRCRVDGAHTRRVKMTEISCK